MPGKLQKFDEVNSFSNCFYLSYFDKDKGLGIKGKWKKEYFGNQHPIVLELGCGRGEYTIGLAKNNLNKNYIGVDIKGARIWTGAKIATENEMKNVAFIRTRIDFIEYCFDNEEIDEIWITFPDPQPQKARERKRLTNHLFLDRYMKFLKKGGCIHLKTDNTGMYEYSVDSMRSFGLKEIFSTDDLYNHVPEGREELIQIKTYYEKLFTEKGEKIKYCMFQKI
ncbi:MAG: tRNA (guanosine(46)-N7)-methyltransferase TrmB [Bacteroidota bacterium]|jgi:tRNA (guanine-N7-)-methyltransferase